MHHLIVLAAHRALVLPTPRALLIGLLLGALVWAMALTRPGDGFTFAMAMLLLFSGATSFVFHSLAVHPHARAAVPRWLVCLGLGVLAGIGALNLLA